MKTELLLWIFTPMIIILVIGLLCLIWDVVSVPKAKQKYIAIPISGECGYLTIGKEYPIIDLHGYSDDSTFGWVVADNGGKVYECFSKPSHLSSGKWLIRKA